MKKSYSQRQKRIESRGDRIFSGVNAAILILLCIVTLYPIWYVQMCIRDRYRDEQAADYPLCKA